MRGEDAVTPIDWTEAPLVIVDVEGRLVQWSRACEALSGWALAQVRGRPLWEVLVAPEDRERVQAWFVDGARALPAQAECSWRSRDGRRQALRWSHTVTHGPDGRPERVLATGAPAAPQAPVERRDAERLRAMFDHSFQAIGLLSPEGVILEANPSALAFMGLTPAEVLGHFIWEVPGWRLSPEVQARLRRAVEQAAQGTLVRDELEVHGPEGRVATLDFSLVPVVREGRVAFLVPEGRDISRPKRTFEAKLEGVVGAAQEGLITIDEAQRITRFNPGAERIFGYRAVDVLGAPMDVLVPEPAREGHRAQMSGFARAPGPAHLKGKTREVRGRRKGGEEFPAEIVLSRLRLGERTECTVSVRDLTEQRRAEEAQRLLARAGELLATSLDLDATLSEVARLLVPQVADCCVLHLLGPRGEVETATVVHVDPEKQARLDALLHAFPVRLDELHGAGRVIRTGQPECMPVGVGRVREVLSRTVAHLERMRQVGITSSLVVPLRGRAGVLGALALMEGESGRHLGPADLALAEELAHRAALAIENAQLYRAAQQASRARDEVLSIVAHDLRTPLSAIGMCAQRLAALSPREGREGELLERIRTQTARMGRLVDDLLDVVRLEAGVLEVCAEPQEPQRLVADALELAAPLVAGHELGSEVEGPLPAVDADLHRIQQVFANLIGNAVKFTPPGGRICVGARAAEGGVCFWVRDTGTGIPPEQMPHLFDRFWQGRRDDRRGAGLGLVISKCVIEGHGGSLWVQSEPGRGSTFWFTLPLSRPAQARSSA